MSVLEISKLGCHLSTYRGFIQISANGNEYQVPFDQITSIITAAHGITYTQNLLVKLADHNIPMIITNKSFMPVSILTPLTAHHQSSLIVSFQAKATEGFNNKLWKRIVQSKTKHQIEALRMLKIPVGKLSELVLRVKAGDKDNIEAQAAKIYWKKIMGDKFKRSRFGENPNNLLNYGYIILRSCLARHVVAAGLNPSLGIHHKNQRNPFCLVDDLIEPFRPITDLAVIHCLQNQLCELNKDSKAILTSQLTKIIRFQKKWVTLINSMKLMTQSLAISYTKQKDCLKLPKPKYNKIIY